MSNIYENRDSLTGLWKREYAFGILENILGHNGQVALILIDVDRMHAFQNYVGRAEDYRGYSKGDKKLIEIAREIESLSGKNSHVFRYGGDEFGVILYETSLEEAREVAEKIRAHRASFFVESGEKQIETLTLSLGIAHFPTHVSNAENLLAAADLALLKAKGQGKEGGRWPDGTPYSARNRAMAIGDFLDDFPEESVKFLR